MAQITPEEWYKRHQEGNHHVLTVGELKKRLEGVPDDTPVAYQRIEDIYFKKHGWDGIKMIFEQWGDHTSWSDYVAAWSAVYHKKDKFFVIEAHY